MERLVEPEWLDGLAAEHPEAAQSRRDLGRLNAWMANAAVQAAALRSAGWSARLRNLVELGAGDGRFLLRVARRLSVSRAPAARTSVTLIDQQVSVEPQTQRQFLRLGWEVQSVKSDVFAWLHRRGECVEVMVANLFLHHFNPVRLEELLGEIAGRTQAFVATEPRRSRWALWFSRQVRWIGCNRITQHDAPASVRAGFTRQELSRLWPSEPGWRLEERRAGCFGHLFVACRSKGEGR